MLLLHCTLPLYGSLPLLSSIVFFHCKVYPDILSVHIQEEAVLKAVKRFLKHESASVPTIGCARDDSELAKY